MSGAAGNGEYKIIKKNIRGLLAINSSFIGKDFGLETILLDKKEKLFIYKMYINSKEKDNIVEVKGFCDFTN